MQHCLPCLITIILLESPGKFVEVTNIQKHWINKLKDAKTESEQKEFGVCGVYVKRGHYHLRELTDN